MDVGSLRRISLHVAEACSVENVLAKVVEGLASEDAVALARIWLIGPGDLCDECYLSAECSDRTQCLHLAASRGTSSAGDHQAWDNLDGLFRRFPLNKRKVGRIGATGVAELLPIGNGESPWLRDPEWAEREGLRAFAGQPLVYRQEILGVLGVFCRRELDEGEFEWLRVFADHAAVSIANARAFDEIECLRDQLELERDYLREEIKVTQAFEGIIGESPPMQKLLRQVEIVAPTDATVLIEGESGTGKELVASAIHERSQRANGPIVRVNCASIPRELCESEFFGHTAGAFTGAASERAGRFQVAHEGTLFLDEVGEIPIELQGKLLRVLQEGAFSRVGEDHERKVDVRVIAATNRDLSSEVDAGRFRQDLYYRLTVVPVEIPALRDRKQDIPSLVAHFLELSSAASSSKPSLRKRDLLRLQSYDWPGNVRELQNVIERAVILSEHGRLRLDVGVGGVKPTPGQARGEASEVLTEAEIAELVRANTVAALERSNWKVSGDGGASELLGMKPNTLASRMKAMGIERPRRKS